MKSRDFDSGYRIRRYKYERPDGSPAEQFEVLDSKGATVKVFPTRELARSWIQDRWGAEL